MWRAFGLWTLGEILEDECPRIALFYVEVEECSSDSCSDSESRHTG